MSRRKRTYDVSLVAYASRYLGTVQAGSEAEAQRRGEELAEKDDGATLCHQCSSKVDLGDFDEVHVSAYPDDGE